MFFLLSIIWALIVPANFSMCALRCVLIFSVVAAVTLFHSRINKTIFPSFKVSKQIVHPPNAFQFHI